MKRLWKNINGQHWDAGKKCIVFTWAATLLSILAAGAVYVLLVLCLEVLRREEILQLPKGEKLAKFLFKS